MISERQGNIEQAEWTQDGDGWVNSDDWILRSIIFCEWPMGGRVLKEEMKLTCTSASFFFFFVRVATIKAWRAVLIFLVSRSIHFRSTLFSNTFFKTFNYSRGWHPYWKGFWLGRNHHLSSWSRILSNNQDSLLALNYWTTRPKSTDDKNQKSAGHGYRSWNPQKKRLNGKLLHLPP